MTVTKDPLDHLDWVDGAPDRASWLAALKVQDMWLAGRDIITDPVQYIMINYGEMREQAETIVKNCRGSEE